MAPEIRRTACFIVVACLFLAGCGWLSGTRTPAPGAEDNTRDPQWVVQHTPRAQVAAVFVHGVFGDTLATWTASKDVSFFQLLNNDTTMRAPVDLFAFGYTSEMIGDGSFTIDEAAKKLRERLEYNGVLDYPAVVFVAHSMGGLVVIRTLLTYRDLMPHVPLIALYATPQDGSQIADIARYVSPNPAISEMIPGDRNRYLEALDNDWKEAIRTQPIPVVCAYEGKATYHLKIVPRGSATRYCTEPSAVIDADHITITKPDRAGHDSIVLLVNALNRYITGRPEDDKPAQTGIGVRTAGKDALVDGSLVVGDNVGISDTGTRTTIRNSVVVGSKTRQTDGSKTAQTQAGIYSAGEGAVIDRNVVIGDSGPSFVDVGRGTTSSNNIFFSIDSIANLPDSLRTLRDVCDDRMKDLPEGEVRQRRNMVKPLEDLILANIGTDLVKPKMEEILRICTAR